MGKIQGGDKTYHPKDKQELRQSAEYAITDMNTFKRSGSIKIMQKPNFIFEGPDHIPLIDDHYNMTGMNFMKNPSQTHLLSLSKQLVSPQAFFSNPFQYTKTTH